MNQSLIAVRYANALFKLAQEKGLLEVVYHDLSFIDQTILLSEDLKSTLTSPVYKPSKKKEILKLLFQNKVNDVCLRFLDLIIDKNREEYLHQVLLGYSDLYRKEKNIKSVTFISAVRNDDAFYGELKNQLEQTFKASVELTIQEKKELIGGFVLIVDGEMMDASILNSLNRIKKQLLR